MRLQSKVRRALWVGLAWLAMAPAGAMAQGQAAYPARPIRLIVPFAAGSAADMVSRTVMNKLAEQLGQSFVIENRAGAGGTIGTAEIARAAPDGYTLGIAAQGTFVNNLVLYDRPGYDPLKDFTLIGQMADVQNLLVVSDTSPYKDVQAVLTAIRGKPADTFRFSSSGVGTSHHIAGALLGQHLGVTLLHVPYTGAPQGMAAIIGGDVDMGLYNLPAALGLVRSGKLRPLALTGRSRSDVVPGVPTLAESGLKDYAVTLWWGLVGPARLPAPVVERLHAGLARVLAQPEMRQTLASQGFTLPPEPLPSSAEFARLVERDIAEGVPTLRKLSAAR